MGRLDQAPKGQWRTFLIALLGTLFLHIMLFVWLPDGLLMTKPAANEDREQTVELTLEPPDPETLRYVEANPEAPENEPDRKDRYSFRAQQAADENPDVSSDNTPSVDGEEASQKIVQGAVEQSEPMFSEAGVFALSRELVGSPDQRSVTAQVSRLAPLAREPSAPDFIRQAPEVEEGPGSHPELSGESQQVVENPDDKALVHLYRAEPTERNQDANEPGGSASAAKPLPRKRPTLPPDLVYGPLMRSEGSASRRGAIAIDATFSQFGEYQQQFYAAVQAGWYQEIDFFQPIDTSAQVRVRFRIQSNGIVDEVTVLQSTATQVATLICQTALTKRSPFRPWTEEMIRVFGRERVMEIVFSYR